MRRRLGRSGGRGGGRRGGVGGVVCSAGASRVYVCPQRDQLFLVAQSMREWVPEDHLAWFVLAAVDALDTRGLHRRPGGSLGRPPYEPEMMCALVLYAYCGGVRSSRLIERACETDAAYRVICGGLVPDHATIARFVANCEPALAGLFVSGLRLCAAAGLVDLAVVALDGTKLAADASPARNRDAVWIRREVAKLMAATAQEDLPADAPPWLPGVEAVSEAGPAGGGPPPAPPPGGGGGVGGGGRPGPAGGGAGGVGGGGGGAGAGRGARGGAGKGKARGGAGGGGGGAGAPPPGRRGREPRSRGRRS